MWFIEPLKRQRQAPLPLFLRPHQKCRDDSCIPSEKTIGIRVPQSNIVMSMLDSLHEPMMSVTLMMPEDEYPMTDAYEINQLLGSHVDMVIDGGYCGLEPTTCG